MLDTLRIRVFPKMPTNEDDAKKILGEILEKTKTEASHANILDTDSSEQAWVIANKKEYELLGKVLAKYQRRLNKNPNIQTIVSGITRRMGVLRKPDGEFSRLQDPDR